MIKAITELLGFLGIPNKETVNELALLMNDIEVALLSRTITEQEYVGLMEDVERLRKIIAAMGEARLNQTINEAIKGLIELAKTVKF